MARELIDIHAHLVPKSFPDDPTGGRAPWPSMQCAACGTQATVMVGAKPFREIDDRSWDPLRRIADMDADGVTAQALSPMPELLSYWIETGPATELCRHVNGAIAEMAAAHPRRFYGLGSVPMQDPVRAAEEMRRVKSQFGLQGIEVGSNVNGKYLGSRDFDPVFAAAVELDLCIFVHALHPLVAPSLAPYQSLTPFVGFPIDTAMCAATIIRDGVLERFPGLRIGFSHGGGVLGPLVHRMEQGWSLSGGFDGALPRPPSAYAAQMYYDSLVYQADYAAHLIKHVAPDRVFLGTDYPYSIMQVNPRGFIEECVARSDADSLWSAAAQRFLGV